MEIGIIIDVLLHSYKGLENLCEKIDAEVERRARAGMFKDIMTTFEKISRLTEEKKTYCNIKVIIDEALDQIGRNQEIKLCYRAGLDFNAITIKVGANQNAVKKRISRQRKKLFEYIKAKHSYLYLMDLIKNSHFLMGMYREFEKLEKQKPKITA